MKGKLLDSSLQLKADKIIVKPNFVIDVHNESIKRMNSFLFIGRLSYEKGIHLLIDAFKGLENTKLIIAGDGPEKELVKHAVVNNDNITFVGHRSKDEINHLLQSCQALIFPSIWYEGLPMTIIEAFANGTPVIASNLGAMSEMIINGFNGLHFVPNNSNQLQSAIKKFLDLSDNIKESMQQNAKNTYIEKYHPDIHYNSIINIYTKAIEKNSVRK
jgi:glycosyltransferase involved in cell wall biosynthesis